MIKYILSTSGLVLIAMLVQGCSDSSEDILFDGTLKPGGEKLVLDRSTSETIWVGMQVTDPPDSGKVFLEQIDTSAWLQTTNMSSRLWKPEDGQIKLKVVNDSQSKVSVVIFLGDEAPAN